MDNNQRRMPHSLQSSTLGDVLERILDKGVVISGDIKIKLVDIELLTIQIRLLICSVDKAKELGINWWSSNPYLTSEGAERKELDELAFLRTRVLQLEQALSTVAVKP